MGLILTAEPSTPVALLDSALASVGGTGALALELRDPAMGKGWNDVLGAGTVSLEVMERVRRTSNDDVADCYKAALSRDPAFAGRVLVKLEIGPEGNVVRATPLQSLPDTQAVQCIVEKLKGLHFPKPSDGVTSVVYPYSFRAAQPKKRDN